MIITYDFRYENTLRLNFGTPVGLATNGVIDQEDLEEFKSKFGLTNPEVLYDTINNFIHEYFNEWVIEVEIDWRDSYELELHFDSNIETEIFIEQLEALIDEFIEDNIATTDIALREIFESTQHYKKSEL